MSVLLCMTDLAHASKLKEHDDNDDFNGHTADSSMRAMYWTKLLSGVERPEDLLGDKGLMKELKVRLMERMLGAELTEHLAW